MTNEAQTMAAAITMKQALKAAAVDTKLTRKEQEVLDACEAVIRNFWKKKGRK